jgi:hypothetical protein
MENQERVAYINLVTKALELCNSVVKNHGGQPAGHNGFGEETFTKAFREINQSIGKLTPARPSKHPRPEKHHKRLSNGKLDFVADETEDEAQEEEEEETPVKPKSKKQRIMPVFDDDANDGDEDEDDVEDDEEENEEGDDEPDLGPECPQRYGAITDEQLAKLKGLVEKGLEKNKLVTIRMVVPLFTDLFIWRGSYERRTKRKRGAPYTHMEMANIEMIASYIKLVMPDFGKQLYDYANPGGKKSSSGRIGTISDAVFCPSAPINMNKTPLFGAFISEETLAGTADVLSKCIISMQQTVVLGEAKKKAKADATATIAKSPAAPEKPGKPAKAAKAAKAPEPDVVVTDDNGEEDGVEEEEEEKEEEEEEAEDDEDDEDSRKDF